jgi:hypothetical protein
MASTFAVTRKHLIFGLCLPLAVLLGYLLAEPYASASISILVVLFAVLFIPVMMRWYHPLLVFSWYLAMQPAFIPGRLQIWVLMSFAALFFAVLNRSVDPDFRMTFVKDLTWPLLVLLVVVIATAMATGGIGFRSFGSKEVGGKSYVTLIGAIVGYFALSMRPIKPQHARLALAMFFLPAITSLTTWVAGQVGSAGNFVYYLFPDISGVPQTIADLTIDPGMQRLVGFMPAAIAVFCWLLSRYGVTGILDMSRPWRVTALLGVIVAGSLGGFRSMLLLMLAIFLLLGCLERVWHSRAFLILLMGGTIGIACLVAFADKLPFPVQRALSFLPVEVDPLARQGAQWSTEWRLEMWKSVAAEIPNYLFIGKGYTLSSTELALVIESTTRGYVENWAGSAMAGDYHNGPLSVIIPFGIWGAIAFLWVLYAGTRYLHRVYRNSSEELKEINRFLLALFVARILFFFFVFGAFYIDFYHLTGILGLSVALNAANQTDSEPQQVPEFDDGPK